MGMSVSRGYSGAQVFTALRIASAQADIINGMPPAIAWSRWSLWQCPAGITGLRFRLTDRAGGSPQMWLFGGPMTDFESMIQLGSATGASGNLDVTITGLTPGTSYAIAMNCSALKCIVTYENVTTRCVSPLLTINGQTGVATITNSYEPNALLIYRINDGDWQDYSAPVQMPENSYIYAITQAVPGKLESVETQGAWFTS